MVDFGAATVVGGIAGKIGGSGVNGRKLRGIYRRANDVIKTAKSARRIAKYVAKKTAIKVTVKSVKKYYDYYVNRRNTPHLDLYTKLIGMFYFWNGMNFILGSAYALSIGQKKISC